MIAVAPNNDLLEKLKSNLQEVRARGGELIVFADPESGITERRVTVIEMPKHISISRRPWSIPCRCSCWRITLRY